MQMDDTLGVSDNDVVHVEAEAHATQPTDRVEQRAGSSEGVKKIKEKHSTTEFVNRERKDDERNADDDCTSGNMQNDGIRVATRRVDDTLFMQLRMWMGIFRPRPLDHSLVQSTTKDIRDEKNAEEDDDEDELITVRSPQNPSPRYRAEEQSRTDWEALIRDKLAQKAWTTTRLAIRRWQMQQNNSSVRCITWTHANWAKSRRLASSS